MALLLKVQANLRDIEPDVQLTKRGSKKLNKRMKKACKTRWLSFDKSVVAILDEYKAVVQTLRVLDEEEKCPISHGLLARITDFKFLAGLCMLEKVLPVLANLSKTFQYGSFNFSQTGPSISYAKWKLNKITENDDVITDLRKKIKDNSYEMLTPKLLESEFKIEAARGLVGGYITAMQKNILVKSYNVY